MTYEVKKLGKEQIGPAMELALRVFMEFEAPEYSEEGVREFKEYVQPGHIADMWGAGQMTLWGCFAPQGRLAGVIAMAPASHVSLLFVDKEYHRMGMAKAMLGQALAACEKDCTEMDVNSSPYAVEVYRRLGFVPTGPEQTVNGLRFTPMKYTMA